MTLTTKVLLGMALGISPRDWAINLHGARRRKARSFRSTSIDGLFGVVGSLFVNALKMLVVPLVLFSLISGVCGIGDIRLLGRIGSKAFAALHDDHRHRHRQRARDRRACSASARA